MIVAGRRRETGTIRRLLDLEAPVVIRVSGPDGAGKTTLVRHATDEAAVVYHRCPPLPEPSQRSSLLRTLAQELTHLGLHDPSLEDTPSDWPSLFGWWVEAGAASRRPLVLVLDDAHRLGEARARIQAGVEAALRQARERGTRAHLVLTGPPDCLPFGSGSAEVPVHDVTVGTLPFRAALPGLPGSTAREKLEAYGAFGGLPGVLSHVDPNTTLATNLRRLVLEDRAPLSHVGTDVLERSLQTPSRYAAILSALSEGEAEWGAVHAGVSDLTTSGQVAPYLRKLEAMELVEVRRSLDATHRSRNRRYRIRDPFLAFWFRLARLTDWGLRSGDDGLTSRQLRASVESQARAIFPEVCRQYMAYDVMEELGANAREVGGLWGAHHDIEVAGILTSGASFYGQCIWDDDVGPGHLRSLDREVRETRYGFGRENRLRLLFSGSPAGTAASRAVARRHEARIITIDDIAGDLE